MTKVIKTCSSDTITTQSNIQWSWFFEYTCRTLPRKFLAYFFWNSISPASTNSKGQKISEDDRHDVNIFIWDQLGPNEDSKDLSIHNHIAKNSIQ